MPVSKNYVYSVSRAEFVIAGVSFPVSTVTLSLALSNIPMCTVGISPKAGATGNVINALSVKSLRTTYEAIGRKARELAESSLHIRIERYDADTSSKSGEQKLDLDGWLLAGVGISGLNVTTGFQLTCTIFHPAYNLNRYEGMYFNASGTLKMVDVIGKVTNPVDAGIAAIEQTITQNANEMIPLCDDIKMSTPLKTQAEVSNAIKDAMEESKKNIGTYLKWDTKYNGGVYDLPGESAADEDMKKGIKYALANMWGLQTPGSGGSAWKTLYEISGIFNLDIIPTYTEKQLIVSPSNPWKKPAVTIDEAFVSELNLPSMDPSPIFGLIQYEGNANPVNNTNWTYAESAGQHSYMQPTNMAFVPAKNDISSGSLIGFGTPPWVMEAMHASTMLGSDESFTYAEGDDLENANEPESGDSIDLKAWNAIKMMCMASAFMAYYRQGVVANLACPFMTRTEKDELLIPGKVMQFMAEGGVMFTGLVQRVTSSIDCARSIGSTSITAAYCSSPGYTDNVLGSSPEIPLFGNSTKASDAS